MGPVYGQKARHYASYRNPSINKYFPKHNKIGPLPLRDDFPLIVLDPGHGGKDLGTHSIKVPKYQEKNFTLATARMLKAYLQQLGFLVVMTRNDDRFISLDKRAEFANDRQPKVFISLHYNSAPNPLAEGIEIFYYRCKEQKARTFQSERLAKTILKRTLETSGAKSRGVKHGNLAVLRETEMAAVLVEGGFLTHEEEREKLKNAVYLKKLAWGIAQGIRDYLASN